MPIEQYQETRLPNGIQVVTEAMPHSHSVTIGIWVRSGPRHETAEESGISHFVEHMLFKGTRSRTAKQINESLYPVGGHLNAFTDREFTCYTAVVLREHLSMAMEVLSDMLVNSLFAAEEIGREKQVILEEIKAIEDAPEDLVHDILVNTLWPCHPLGQPVIGQKETVARLSREAILSYVHQRYVAPNVLVAVAGNLDHDEIVTELQKWLGTMDGKDLETAPGPPTPRSDSALIYRRTKQAHLVVGMPAFAQRDDDNYPLIIVDTVLGGGPHSRLFDEIRENRGLAYSVGSSVNAYADAGIFTIYASTSRRNLNTVLRLMWEQMDKVAQEGLPEDEIELARQHIRASLLLSNESTGARMGRLANSYLYFGRMVPFEEVIDKLESVTGEDVLRVSRTVLQRQVSALAVIGPVDPAGRQADQLRAA